jgi:hypothetical protein
MFTKYNIYQQNIALKLLNLDDIDSFGIKKGRAICTYLYFLI